MPFSSSESLQDDDVIKIQPTLNSALTSWFWIYHGSFWYILNYGVLCNQPNSGVNTCPSILEKNDFILKFFPAPFFEVSGMSLLETKRIALGPLVLFYHFMFSIIHKLHERAVPLLPSLFQGFTSALLVHGHLDSTPLMCINIYPTLPENFKLRPCSLHLYSFESF
jgi:hypothetical protein